MSSAQVAVVSLAQLPDSQRSRSDSSTSFFAHDDSIVSPSRAAHAAMAPSAIVPLQHHVAPVPGPQVEVNDSKALISRALRGRVARVDIDGCAPGGEDPFFVADMGEVYRQHKRWKLNIPRVEPFYVLTILAVKCNSDKKVLKLLAQLGTGFDCASKKEIDAVLDLGVPASRIIYANPCKTASYIRYAAQRDVRKMTFDNADELYKVKRYFPEAELFLRIITDDSASLCQLSNKYGAPMSVVPDLLRLARDLELNVTGVSFHTGSGASRSEPFIEAIENARKVFDLALEFGFDLKCLDIGGGFGNSTFENIASVVGPCIDKHFPSTVRVIAEPGRYYVASAFTLACHVIARRTVMQPEEAYMIYLNDGVYGNMNCILYDHQHPVPRVLTHKNKFMYNQPGNATGSKVTSVWGPTCDGLDCISERCSLPFALDVGDWMYFEDLGAYTLSASTGFNGFNDNCEVVYVCSEKGAKSLLCE
ncbi:pyridoxal-dependent decarboxylase [Dipodascopsis tothii]|uniref:pyridoxal-dependent decarboxylase n=1 Tax=Dipodascopsis tothii TaxID=44089 RepID=UPI0034CFB00D